MMTFEVKQPATIYAANDEQPDHRADHHTTAVAIPVVHGIKAASPR
jgi:hypothetical protein